MKKESTRKSNMLNRNVLIRYALSSEPLGKPHSPPVDKLDTAKYKVSATVKSTSSRAHIAPHTSQNSQQATGINLFICHSNHNLLL